MIRGKRMAIFKDGSFCSLQKPDWGWILSQHARLLGEKMPRISEEVVVVWFISNGFLYTDIQGDLDWGWWHMVEEKANSHGFVFQSVRQIQCLIHLLMIGPHMFQENPKALSHNFVFVRRHYHIPLNITWDHDTSAVFHTHVNSEYILVIQVIFFFNSFSIHKYMINTYFCLWLCGCAIQDHNL